jgi:hypothetical protein
MTGLVAAIEKEIVNKCDDMAKKLVCQACEGKESSLRLILQLSDAVQCSESSHDGGNGRSIAEEWGSEPEFRHELCEASAEMGSGGVEPEG